MGTTRFLKMISKVLVLHLVVAAVVCEGEEPELPTWWIAQPDAGQVPSDAWCGYTKQCYDAAECDIKKYKEIVFNKSPTSSIVLPESASDDVCIIFPHAPNSVRHGKGRKLFCNEGCCAWEPPSERLRAQEKPELDTWYETSSDSCSETQGEKAPLLFNGRQSGEEVNVCVNKNSGDGEFQLLQGKIGFCAYGCCSFLEEIQ